MKKKVKKTKNKNKFFLHPDPFLLSSSILASFGISLKVNNKIGIKTREMMQER